MIRVQGFTFRVWGVGSRFWGVGVVATKLLLPEN